ncbi:MAG: branched-chain amino acid ABC transporter permease, partial [Dehalococcoidia bacterium]|nr:branched-chain amino acid ABC transporter permease [Dehalococcoidia bacterium]
MLPCGIYNTSYAQQFSIIRTRLQWVYVIFALALAISLPLYAGSYFMTFAVYFGITTISALGLMLLSGYCGLWSMGHAAFMMIGAFTTANLTSSGMNFFLALLIGAIVAAAVGTFFGLPSGKVKDFYLVLSTLAGQFIIVYVIISWFKGDTGVHIPPVTIGNLVLDQAEKYWYLVLAFLIGMTFLAKNITRTKVGRAFVAIRDNDVAAAAMGINTFAYKLMAFALAGFFAGIAGGLWVGYISYATWEHFTIMDSIWYLGIILIGGAGSIAGAYFGAFFVRGVKEISYV